MTPSRAVADIGSESLSLHSHFVAIYTRLVPEIGTGHGGRINIAQPWHVGDQVPVRVRGTRTDFSLK